MRFKHLLMNTERQKLAHANISDVISIAKPPWQRAVCNKVYGFEHPILQTQNNFSIPLGVAGGHTSCNITSTLTSDGCIMCGLESLAEVLPEARLEVLLWRPLYVGHTSDKSP